MNLKFGKQPAIRKPTDLKASRFTVSLPPLPTRPFGYGTLYSDWKMLANNKIGDCEIAGLDHQFMLYNKVAGHPISFTDATATGDYSAITGYVPGDPSTDRGTYTQDLMGYARNTGMLDSNGKRHKIDAYVWIKTGDWNTMMRCVFTFGAAGIGIAVPESAVEQFDRGEMWDDYNDQNILGYHYVPVVGSMDPANECTFITWARRTRMTKRFLLKNNDEIVIPLSKESLLAAGYNVRHIAWADLNAELAQL